MNENKDTGNQYRPKTTIWQPGHVSIRLNATELQLLKIAMQKAGITFVWIGGNLTVTKAIKKLIEKVALDTPKKEI